MYEQLDLFSFLQTKEKYCFDDDINEIHKRLIAISEKYKLKINSDEFKIWSHVPQYGYRLWLEMKVTKEILNNNNFQEDVEILTNFAKERNVELSCLTGACFFYKEKNTASLPFSTIFMDKKRQKIK